MSDIKAMIGPLKSTDAQGQEYVLYPITLLKYIIDKNGGNSEEIIKSILKNDASNRYASIDHTHEVSLSDMTDAFLKIFPNLGDTVIDRNAMTISDIIRAINTAWDGESSSDPNAMSASDITSALLANWNGESSDDERAISSSQIDDIIAKTTI